jgi:predicted Rossmann fold nucleotide-binding protein DprA/Smf involved in DNA uptake
LISENMRPEDLLRNENVGSAAMGSGIDQERLTILLGRGVQLGFVVEEWQRNGIWIISRSDKDYPARYKKRLKDKAPPLLFGTGDRSLLQGGGIAIVGSRNVDADGEAFTCQTAELCAYNTIPVVSGGARGVDRIAMTAALEAGGVTIGVLAENLLKKSLERNSRNAIADGRLLLISPYHPNAHFTVGTAMGRNKLVYSIADYGLVVSADHKNGGTWAGVAEELKRENSLTVFVRLGATVPLGNKNLLDLGALEWPEVKIPEKLSQQLADLAANRIEKNMQRNLNLFDFQNQSISQTDEAKNAEKSETPPVELMTEESPMTTSEYAIYRAVLPVIMNHLGSPTTIKELSKTLNVSKTQLNNWIKKAVNEGEIRKLSRPVRYEKIKVDKFNNMDGVSS